MLSASSHYVMDKSLSLVDSGRVHFNRVRGGSGAISIKSRVIASCVDSGCLRKVLVKCIDRMAISSGGLAHSKCVAPTMSFGGLRRILIVAAAGTSLIKSGRDR